MNHIPVLVVGAGAGGLATSALLAKHGVRSLLVERRREVFVYPKARNLAFAAWRFCAALASAMRSTPSPTAIREWSSSH